MNIPGAWRLSPTLRAWRKNCFEQGFRLGTTLSFGCIYLFGCVFLFGCLWARGQGTTPSSSPTNSSPPQSSNQQTSAEITAQDQPAMFKVNANLVVVRTVVRDAQGHAIGNLKKDDFEVFDRGKAQVITQFEVEQPGDLSAKARQSSEQNGNPAEPLKASSMPERFIAYIFDDVHLQFGDLAQVRDAAKRHFATLRATDRAAIFTTSGQTVLDYTDDRAQLNSALLRLMPRPLAVGVSHNAVCPDISYYQADLIFNKKDPEASSVAMQEALTCPSVLAALPNVATQLASGLVSENVQLALSSGTQESRVSLTVLNDVVRNLATKPGQREIVLVSPGFIAPEMEFEYYDIINRAVRAQVVISALDARGLYTVDPLGDIANPPQVAPPPQKAQFIIGAANANQDLMAAFADGTGGIFFHNSNDLDDGFRRTGEAPAYSYMLAFSPQNLRLDGSFHALRVSLKNSQKLTVQARRGYFAPKHAADPEQQAKQEIEDAMYSQEEVHNLPVSLQTQFFKASDDAAKLIVLAHVDVQRMHYRKADGRNNDVLTCVSAVFNRNGNFVEGLEKTVTMHWRDETLEHRLGSGITLKSSFDVKPGSYFVRLVVRDSEGQLMSAENGTVEIR